MSLLISTLSNNNINTLNWHDFFSRYDLKQINYDLSWHLLFCILFKHPKFDNLNTTLKNIIKKNNVYPLPTYITSAFMITSADNLKVVFINQEPYCNHENGIPQAMGLSYSVPNNIKIPSTLNNIFNNLIKYKHIDSISSGNLWYWAAQGCLMLCSSLTVNENEPGSHLKMWSWFTDYIIQYISQYMNNIIFVLWGSHAYKKINMIDQDKHHTIITSHPSKFTVNNKFQNYPSFAEYDHFGTINQILVKIGKSKIMWQ